MRFKESCVNLGRVSRRGLPAFVAIGICLAVGVVFLGCEETNNTETDVSDPVGAQAQAPEQEGEEDAREPAVTAVLLWGDDEVAVSMKTGRESNSLYAARKEDANWRLLDSEVTRNTVVSADDSEGRRLVWTHQSPEGNLIFYSERATPSAGREIERLPVSASERYTFGLLSPQGRFVAVFWEAQFAVYDLANDRFALRLDKEEYYPRNDPVQWAWAPDDHAVTFSAMLDPSAEAAPGTLPWSWCQVDPTEGGVRTSDRLAGQNGLFWCERAGGFSVVGSAPIVGGEALPGDDHGAEQVDHDERVAFEIIPVFPGGMQLALREPPQEDYGSVSNEFVFSARGEVIACRRELEKRVELSGSWPTREELRAMEASEPEWWEIILWRRSGERYTIVNTWRIPIKDKPQIGLSKSGEALAIAVSGDIRVVDTHDGKELWRRSLP